MFRLPCDRYLARRYYIAHTTKPSYPSQTDGWETDMCGNTVYLIGGNGRTKKDEKIPVLGYQLFLFHMFMKNHSSLRVFFRAFTYPLADLMIQRYSSP